MMTKCPESATALMQTGSRKANGTLRVCEGSDGFHLVFPDAKMQAKLERMMTPEARLALRAALGQIVTKQKASFLEIGGEATQPVEMNTTTPVLPTYAVETVP